MLKNFQNKIIRVCSQNYENIGPKDKEVLELNEDDVVICTCSCSMDERLKILKYKFIIIDEATQLLEPECLLPITHGTLHVTQIGDDKQLGPVLTNPLLVKEYFNFSLFERIINSNKTNSSINHTNKSIKNFTMLKIQYRMYPKIVDFSNINFYENELINGVKETESYHSLFIRKFFYYPLVFVNNKGKERKGIDYKSYYNLEEVTLMIKIIHALIYNCHISPKNIELLLHMMLKKEKY